MLSFLHHSKTNAVHIDASFKRNANRRPKYILMLLFPFFAILAQAPFVAVRGQTPLVITSVTPDNICSSPQSVQIDIFVKITASGYNSGNDFRVRIDTADGDFSNNVSIGAEGGISVDPGIVGTRFGAKPGDYKIRVYSDNPVDSSNVMPIHVTDGNDLDPRLELTTRDVSSCGDGSDGIITGVVTGGIPPFLFYFIDKQFITNPNTDNVVDNLAPGTYGMMVQDAAGCRVAAAGSLVQISLPSIEVSTKGNVSACGSHDGRFTLRVFPRTGIYATAIKPFSFKIAKENGDLDTAAYVVKPVPVTFSGLARAVYKVRMRDGAGCESEDSLQNIVIKKDTALFLKLSGWGNPTTCGGNDGDITVQATFGSHSTYRYSLKKHGAGAYGPEQSGRRFGGLTAGTYIIKGRDSRGCFDTLHKTLNDPKSCSTGIASSTDDLTVMDKNSLKLQVFPNPARTAFTLTLQSSSKESVQIMVTDMFGKKLYQTTGNSNRQYTFGSEFNSGMYIVQVIQGKQIQTLKLVKEN